MPKKFIVEFEGEEEADDSYPSPRGLPDFLLFHSNLEHAVGQGNRLHEVGIPVWLVKYKHIPELFTAGISKDTYFAVGVERGPFIEVDEDEIYKFASENPGVHFHIEVKIPSVYGQSVTAELIQFANIIEMKQWGNW